MDTQDSDLIDSVRGLLEGETDLIANAANISALMFERMGAVNWVGFYFLRGAPGDETLVLGPFQGRVACVRIKLGQGVCGAAAARRETIVVADVHEFPGHIACDDASQSEIVVPLLRQGELIGVLDIDSPVKNRFTETDKRVCEQVGALLMQACQS